MERISVPPAKLDSYCAPDCQETEKPEGMSEEEWSVIRDMSSDLRQTSISLWDHMRVKRCLVNSLAAEQSPTLSEDIKIPLCPDLQRASPNVFLRSAIFSAIQGKNRRAMKNELVAAQGGYEIRITVVETLDQFDFDVWLQAVHLARCSPLGTVCTFTGNSFLRAIGRSNGKSDYTSLKKSLIRLRSAVLEIKGPDSSWITLNLIQEAGGINSRDVFMLSFNSLLIKLFAPDSWTALQWEQRLLLKRKSLALWLHGYFASHAAPFPIKISTLMEMCGSETKEKKHFKAALKRALVELEKVTSINSYFDGDLVIVKKIPSKSQGRYLLKNEIKKIGKNDSGFERPKFGVKAAKARDLSDQDSGFGRPDSGFERLMFGI
jgi:TrfA protein